MSNKHNKNFKTERLSCIGHPEQNPISSPHKDVPINMHSKNF